MAHSNSSLNTFASCMAKYEHSYILHTPPCKPPSPHLAFGVMAHEVLYKAGKLRDEINDKVSDGEYMTIIPSEVLYPELKSEFNIQNWYRYFVNVVKQVAKYENDCVNELREKGNVQIEREVKLQLTVDQLRNLGITGINQPIVGIIDLLIIGDGYATILDYKFSSNRKTQDDFDQNSQLPLYALFVHYLYDIPLHNIKVGYIDIPKQDFGKPTVLSNGTISRAKTQNVSQEQYEEYVNAIHGRWYVKTESGLSQVEFDPCVKQICEPDEYYNCRPGGYYYDCWCQMALNKAAYLSVQYIDIDTYINVTQDLFNAARMIDMMIANKLPFLRKYDAYSCKSCEYVNTCKKWLGVNNE